VARRIVNALERGINYKKVVGYYMDKIMESGATGVQIKAAGKMAGRERSRFQKFKKGFVAFSGEYANTLVDTGFAQANLRVGVVGIRVKIMRESPKEFELRQESEAKEPEQSK